MEKLYFTFVIILGSVLYNVAEVSTQPEWGDRQILNQMQKFDSFQQQPDSPNKFGEIGEADQSASNPFLQLVSDVAERLVSSRDNKTNSYDLREAIQFLNAHDFPAVADINRTHNGSDDQGFSAMFNAAASDILKPGSILNYLNSLNNASGNPLVADNNRTHNGSDDQGFSAMFNAAASDILKPESILNYLNSLKNASASSNLFAIDDTVTINSDALSKQFQKQYEEAMSRFAESLNSNKTSDMGVSPNDTSDVESNINNQLSQMLKWPNAQNGN